MNGTINMLKNENFSLYNKNELIFLVKFRYSLMITFQKQIKFLIKSVGVVRLLRLTSLSISDVDFIENRIVL